MIYRTLIFYLRETAFRTLFKHPNMPEHPDECFLNPPCGCSKPGKELQCEDCPYLEACLSQFKTLKAFGNTKKLSVTPNTKN
jgi:hypothetical protein